MKVLHASVLFLAVAATPIAAQDRQGASFRVEEATIAEIHEAFEAETLTCRQLIELYLDRIRAYEDAGPQLNAITTLNPNLSEAAARLDAERQQARASGPLHCIPVLLKDNIHTADMPTSSGSIILESSVPPEDATIVEELESAGALILGKAAMGELATGSYNTIDGQQLNPYDFERETGGSSSGSAAAVSANLTAVAVGTDTYTSVRTPATFTGIVGLRPTTGLVSREGISTRKPSVDTAGPMARTVTDATILLNALAGADPEDPLSLGIYSRYPETDFTRYLQEDALEGARLGVVRDFFGGDPEIVALAQEAVAEMETLGAELVDVRLDPDFLDRYIINWVENIEVPLKRRFQEDWEAYLATLGPDVPKTVEDWVRIYETEVASSPLPPATGRFSALTELKEALMHSSDDPAHQDVVENVLPALTRLKLAIFERHNVDALVFPYKSTFAPPLNNPLETVDDPTYVSAPGEPSPDHLGGYSSVGFPMIVVPMGFGTHGLPAAIAIMGRPYAEGTILGYAYAYEQATNKRRAPPLLPPLD